jgi:hypothetical protein
MGSAPLEKECLEPTGRIRRKDQAGRAVELRDVLQLAGQGGGRPKEGLLGIRIINNP